MGQLNYARLQAVIQNMSAGVCSTDADRRILWANAAFSQLTGHPLDELVGRRPLDFLIGAGVDPALVATLRARLEGSEPFQGELPLRRRDGSSRWVHMAMQPVFDADGMLHEFVAVLTDVTERREADETLRRSTALLEATQSTAHVGGWALDVATGRLYWSAETYLIHDTTPADYTPDVSTAIGFYTAESAAVIEDAVRHAIDGREYDVEVELITARGRRRWVRTMGRPVYAQGRVVQLIGAIRDVTEQRAAEAALRASEARLRSMVEHAPLGIMLTTSTGELTYANSALLRMCGLTAEQARERGPILSLHPDDRERLVRNWHEARRLGTPHNSTGRYLRPDGSVVWWEGTTAPIVVDGDLSAHVVMVLDVSERLTLEREVVESVGREQHQIGIELHDGLGQALTGLAISLESLARRAAAQGNALSPDLRELSGLASQSVAACRDIAEGLAPMQLARGGLRNALRALAQSARSMYGVEVQCSVRGLGALELPTGTAHQLYRIAQEAISNAVRHGQARQIALRVLRLGDRLQMTVVDDGRGMPERPSGEGMGLHTMRYRARMIDAELDVDEIPDGGVRVRCQMRVPRALLAMARQASGSQDAPSPPQPPGPLPQPHAARAS